MYIDKLFLTKKPKTYNGEKKASSINGARKIRKPHAKNETRLLFDILYKN